MCGIRNGRDGLLFLHARFGCIDDGGFTGRELGGRHDLQSDRGTAGAHLTAGFRDPARTWLHGHVGSIRQQDKNQRDERAKKFGVHSAFNTISKSAKLAAVNTTQYAAKSLMWVIGEDSPVNTAVVALTIPVTAGIETGKSSNGSINSRLRVRMDMAAKKRAVDHQGPGAQQQDQYKLPRRPH